MALISTIVAGIGIAASVAGSVVSYRAQQSQARQQRAAVAVQAAAQERVEQNRVTQMNLDASRRKREVFRQQQLARAAALSTAAAQGAQDGSGVGGAFGGIAGQSGVNYLGISQNQEIGNNIADANRMSRGANNAYNLAGASGGASLGGAISSLGGAFVKNAGTIGQIGTYFSSREATAG